MRGQALALLISRLLGAASQALIVIILARHLSVADFGHLNSVIGIGLVATSAADFGVSTLLAKARAVGDEKVVRGAVLFSRGTSALVGLVGAALLSVLAMFGDVSAAYVVLACALALEKNIDCLLSIPVADGDRAGPAVSLILRRLVALVGFLALLLGGSTGDWAYCLSYLLGAIAGQAHWFWLASRLPLPKEARASTSYLIRESTPYFLSNFSAQLRTLDVPITAAVGTAASAGLYAGASKLVSPFLMIPGVVTTVIMPHVARMAVGEARTVARKLMLAALIFLVLLMPAILLASPLAQLVLGEDYRLAGSALAWALVGLPFVALTSPLGSVLQSQGHEKLVAAIGVTFALMTVAAVAIGAFVGGAIGASAGVTLTYVAKSFGLVWGVEKRLRPATRRHVSVSA